MNDPQEHGDSSVWAKFARALGDKRRASMGDIGGASAPGTSPLDEEEDGFYMPTPVPPAEQKLIREREAQLELERRKHEAFSRGGGEDERAARRSREQGGHMHALGGDSEMTDLGSEHVGGGDGRLMDEDGRLGSDGMVQAASQVTLLPGDMDLCERRAGEEKAMDVAARRRAIAQHDARRLVRRNFVFHQSEQRLRLRRKHVSASARLFLQDLFHKLLLYSTWKLALGYCVLYVSVVLIFATFYWWLYPDCNSDFETFGQASMFSIISLSTIGYGTTDPYFNGCASMAALITVQTIVGILLDAVAVGLVFEKFSDASARAAMVIFSRNAVIRRLPDGDLAFQVRVSEIASRQLVDAQMQLIAVMTHIDEDGTAYHCHPTNMRICRPDDEIGEGILLSLANTCTHRLSIHQPGERDIRSPLVPPNCPYDEHHRPIISETELMRYWRKCQLEVIALIEGMDPITSDSIQGMHSYLPHEIRFGYKHAPCVFPHKGKFVMRMSSFHTIMRTNMRDPLAAVEDSDSEAKRDSGGDDDDPPST